MAQASRTSAPAVKRGVWATSGAPGVSAGLTGLGFDWVCLDAQHGRFDDRAVSETLSARRHEATPVYVRLLSGEASLVGRALDAGARGVIVPMVNSGDEAQRVVDAALYPPLGTRSWGPFLGGYDVAVPAPAAANERVEIHAMIETADALDRVDEIAATTGLTGLFVGPFDLAIALGTTLDAVLASDASTSPLARIAAAAARAGIVAGAFAGTPERAARLAELGFTFLAVATDDLLLARGAAAVLASHPPALDG